MINRDNSSRASTCVRHSVSLAMLYLMDWLSGWLMDWLTNCVRLNIYKFFKGYTSLWQLTCSQCYLYRMFSHCNKDAKLHLNTPVMWPIGTQVWLSRCTCTKISLWHCITYIQGVFLAYLVIIDRFDCIHLMSENDTVICKHIFMFIVKFMTPRSHLQHLVQCILKSYFNF